MQGNQRNKGIIKWLGCIDNAAMDLLTALVQVLLHFWEYMSSVIAYKDLNVLCPKSSPKS
jgi:hypothetical protein